MNCRNKKYRYLLSFSLLGILTVIFFALNIRVGSTYISVSELIKILLSDNSDSSNASIILKIRIPRVMTAMLLGGALALSGYLLQTFFHNPIAGPFVLGVSSGAKLTVALVMIFSASRFFTISSAVMIMAAYAGSMLSLGIVLILSQKVRQMSMLVVCGVMIGYICTAVTDLAVTFAEDSDIVNLHNWSRGTFSGAKAENVSVMAAFVLSALILTFFLSKPISAYQLGEGYAISSGVNVKLLRAALILLSGFLSACVTAFAGPVSFVGIAVPHLVKTLFGTSKPIILIPASFLGGGIFCMMCDMIARTAFSPTELSISTVTAIFGAPIVIILMLKRRKGDF